MMQHPVQPNKCLYSSGKNQSTRCKNHFRETNKGANISWPVSNMTFTLMALKKENMLVAMTMMPRQALRGKNQQSKITFILGSTGEVPFSAKCDDPTEIFWHTLSGFLSSHLSLSLSLSLTQSLLHFLFCSYSIFNTQVNSLFLSHLSLSHNLSDTQTYTMYLSLIHSISLSLNLLLTL